MKRKNITLAGIIILIALASFFFDQITFSALSTINSDVSDWIMSFFSNKIIIAIFFITASIFLFRKTHHFIILWTSITITAAIVFLLKLIIHRPRPFGLELSIFGLPDYSFPSMHTSLMFATVYILSRNFKKEKYFFITYASLVGLSRIYLHQHHFSDVLFGGIIGFLIGYVTFSLNERHNILQKFIRRTNQIVDKRHKMKKAQK